MKCVSKARVMSQEKKRIMKFSSYLESIFILDSIFVFLFIFPGLTLLFFRGAHVGAAILKPEKLPCYILAFAVLQKPS
jgi:hypothetical protein